MKRLFRYRVFLALGIYLVISAISLFTGFLLRFDFAIPVFYERLLYAGLVIGVPLKLGVFYAARLHRGLWRYVGVTDAFRVGSANVVASTAFAFVSWMIVGPGFPRSVYIIDFLLCFTLTTTSRFAVRLYNEMITSELPGRGAKGILIYGAGAAGLTLLREIRGNPSLNYRVVGFLDDDRAKHKAVIMGVPVLGEGSRASAIVDRCRKRKRRVEEVVIAMPSATGRQMRDALANCREAGIPCKTVPGIGELLKGKVLTSQIRDLCVTDLLGRQPVRLEKRRIRSEISGRSVLVTGAAGSIGSELCRQIATFEPARLVAFDQAESELFKIDLELREKCPALDLVAEIGDVRDRNRVEEVMMRHAVDSAYHAAAYKHVPLMEGHVLEAIQNNVLGTLNVAQAASRNGVSNFLMISSDKAVNPTSVMGATKRVAELVLSAMPLEGGEEGTKFVSVRFGNVLGSNGSVVPLFQKQIATGGPVTVTHPDVCRYFMSVEEAVGLVLQASTMGKGWEIFVLDMGEPIRIVDLARNMIRLSGRVPDEEIAVRFVGLRPGEKLFEELAASADNIRPTYHEKIKIFQAPQVDKRRIAMWLLELEALLAGRDVSALVNHLHALVPEFQGHQRRQAARSAKPSTVAPAAAS